jgi:hypothetical protein
MVSAMVYLQFADYGLTSGFVASIWGVFVASIFFQIFLYPRIHFFDEGVEIINPLSRHLIGWHEVESIDARYTMSIMTQSDRGKNGRVHAFAAPAPGRYHSRSIHQSELRGLNLGDSGTIRSGESPRTQSGIAAAIARGRLKEFKRLDTAQLIAYRYQFNHGAIIANLAIATIGIIALVFHN